MYSRLVRYFWYFKIDNGLFGGVVNDFGSIGC